MRGRSAGVAACAVAAFAAGCGTARVAEPAHSAPAPTRTVRPGQSDIAADGPLGVRARPGCQSATAGPAGRGGSSKAEFGPLLGTVYPRPGFVAQNQFRNFNSGDMKNPCRAG
jgi:hypothetical protein